MKIELTTQELQGTSLICLKDQPVSAERLRAMLLSWFPYDVRDFGEVPHYCRYFKEVNITCEILISPSMNDHHPDDQPRVILNLAFCKDRFSALSQHKRRLKLGEVDGEVLQTILEELGQLYT